MSKNKQKLSYRATNVNDTEFVYSLLKEKHPNNQIDIDFHNDTKQYTLSVTNKVFIEDPSIPIDVKIKVHYGDTDSIFLSIKYNREDYKQNRLDTFKLGTLCGDKLTHEIFNRPPIEMEFEKVFQPFILLSKKRYIGRKYDNMKNPFEMTKLVTSGIALTRRDYCKMVKKCYKNVLDVIVEMKDNNINVIYEGIDIFKNCVDNIINYKVPFDDLIVTALLAKSYKTRPVHLILAEKLKARNEEVSVGDRLPYIYIEDNSGLNKMKSELGEDPEYAKKHNLKYNRLCYLEQLSKPLLSFFCIILKDFEDKSDELIEYVNKKITSLGGKKLKESDFKLFSSEE
jgi:DNA polymerase delta subunit 1